MPPKGGLAGLAAAGSKRPTAAAEEHQPKKKHKGGGDCALCGSRMDKEGFRKSQARVDAAGGAKSGAPFLCEDCADFADAKGVADKLLVEQKKKAGKSDTLMGDRNEYLQNRGDLNKRDFIGEEVYFEQSSGSRIEETYVFQSRAAFKQVHGAFPDEMRLHQIRVTTAAGQELTGVAIKDPSAMPKLIVWADKTWTRRRARLDPSSHLYRNQAQEVWQSEASASQRTMGQDNGGKYCAKVKSAVAYSNEEIVEAAARFHKKQPGAAQLPSGLAQLSGEAGDPADCCKSGSDGSGDEGSESEDGSGDDEVEVSAPDGLLALEDGAGDGAAVARPSPPAAGAAAPQGRSVRRNAPSQLAAHTTPTKPTKSGRASPSPGGILAPIESPVGGALSCSSGGQGGGRKAASFATSSAAHGDDDDEGRSSRTKPPSYWMATLTPEAAFCSKVSLVRQIKWATGCMTRAMSTNAVEATLGCGVLVYLALYGMGGGNSHIPGNQASDLAWRHLAWLGADG